MASKYLCRDCSKPITGTSRNRYRTHTDGNGNPCKGTGAEIPEDLLDQGGETGDPGVPKEGADFATCPQCDRKVKLTNLGYFPPHDTTLNGGEVCEVKGIRAKYARKTETVVLPGDEPKGPGAAIPEVKDSSAPAAGSSASTGTSSPESATTSTLLSPESTLPGSTSSDAVEEPAAVGPFHLAPLLDDRILQPFSHILQPTPYEKAVLQPMGELAKELATKIKETFYSYSNRRSADNRSAQKTLGPSEIGTPCDRRLAMTLMGIPAVNPGGDGWASFVGTCGHVGMGEVYAFADAGTGRYAVELRVNLGVPTVPHGTTDLLDRRDGTVVDWKFMGTYSLKKFKAEGPSDTYRTQAHVYALGAERGGEKVRNVAIVGLPRAGSSLDEMHVWTEKYDRKFAQAALDRVEKIANQVQFRQPGIEQQHYSKMEVARTFEAGDDCRFCPFHLKGDKEMQRGCPGK